jgi:calcium-independent phospholipase A2
LSTKREKKIIDLFDWIVGTSTGGIIALALVYAKMSIKELQRFYLRLKRDVFSRSGILAKGSSKQLEWYLQKQLKGTMDEVSHPKVLVSAVSQSKSGIDLRFFNNCFEDDFSREKVWRVARYTSAAPLYFTAKDGYLDGGLLSDNPAEDALTAIQQFYRKRRLQLPISLVVSIGSGVNPVEPRKCVNITTELWNLPSQLFPFMKILGEAVHLPRTYVPCLHSI